jgi:hypothetical protein
MVVSVAALISVAVVMQTVERNRRERVRAESQLRKRLENLVYMLDHFPPSFLSTDLKGLVCKSVIDVYEQLLKIAPRNQEYQEGLQAIAKRWNDIKNGKNAGYQPLDNTNQVRDTKALLGLLNNFINRLFETGSITKLQAAEYSRQLKQLFSQTAIDQYSIAARKAEGDQKFRLAIHYYQSAIDKMKKSALDAAMHDQIIAYQKRMAELTELLPSQPDASSASDLESAERDKEWSTFVGTEDDAWKKKKVYD